jgi:geranylgeranyl reductase
MSNKQASIPVSKNNRLYDVIIVGAGPAGLECARVLQDSNLSVLILEKNDHIGPKTCAGGIVDTVEPLNLPEKKARAFNTVTVSLGQGQYEFTTHLSIKIINREALGRHQAELLNTAGNVTIKTGTAVRQIGPHCVATTAGDFGYRFLVGADGSTSMVRRYLNIDSRYMAGIYYDIDERKDRMIFHLDGTVYKAGYIWEFPHQSFTNIGFYYNPSQWKSRDAVRILRNYMQGRGYAMNSKTFRAFPINYLYKGSQFGENTFLTGDAAGLASKLTGEGIAYAMISGREVARKIMDSQYEMSKLSEVVAHKKRQDNLAYFLEKIPIGLNAIYHLHIKALKIGILKWPG